MTMVDKILNEVCLDPRVEDGCFDIYNNLHMEALRDYLTKKGIPTELVLEFSNTILEKGKHPERQAYNVKTNMLDTFPTPEHKQKAIERGSHVEKNPKLSQSNLFGGGQQAPQTANTTSDPQPETTPAVDAGKPPETTQQTQPTPTTAATSPPQPSSPTVAQTPAQGQLAVEPTTTTPTTPQPPPPTPEVKKTPEQIEVEKKMVKNLFNTDDTLPTVAGVGGIGITEDLKAAIKLLVKYI